MAVTDKFFDESREQSVVKAEIVEKYFDAWAGIMAGAQNAHRPGVDHRFGYIDLFAGPGRYKDGAISTPLRVMQLALSKPVYRDRLVTIFNDKDDDNVRSLETAIAELPGIDQLKHKPEVWSQEVGDGIAAQFERINTVPLLAFIDPWGYKGLTLKLVNAFLKSWGCDCIFFFNYSRINAGLSNPKVKSHMAALFGDERATRLATELEPLSSEDREATIVEELAQALREHAGDQRRFVLPFCFKSDRGTRTKHHLILVTKHFKGYDVMKEIMDKASSDHDEGVPSFTFIPPTSPRQVLLTGLNCPLDKLQGNLLAKFAGRTVSFEDVYVNSSIDTPYIRRNYREILNRMESQRLISADPPAAKRPKRLGLVTMAPATRLTFPV